MYPNIAYVPILVSFMQLYIIRSSGNIRIRKGWLRMQYLPTFVSLYGRFSVGHNYCPVDKRVTVHPLS
jgi:hypothetical protein